MKLKTGGADDLSPRSKAEAGRESEETPEGVESRRRTGGRSPSHALSRESGHPFSPLIEEAGAARRQSETARPREASPPAAVFERPPLEPLCGAQAAAAKVIGARVAEDPTLEARLTGASARVSLETGDGKLAVELHVSGKATDVRLTGASAPALVMRRADLGESLAVEGLSLGALTVGAQDPDTAGASEVKETAVETRTERVPGRTSGPRRRRISVKA